MKSRSTVLGVVVVVLIAAAFIPAGHAAEGSSNPVPRVALSTLCGAGVGLLLGGAVALVNNGDNDDEILRWSVVGGTFIGFGYGLYYALKHSKTTALLEFQGGGVLAHAPIPVPTVGAGMAVSLVSVSF